MKALSDSVALDPGIALVTGGSGFVGSSLVRHLLQSGFEVHLLRHDASVARRLIGLSPQPTQHVAPLENAIRLREIVHALQPDYIFHVASASTGGGRSSPTTDLVTVNLLGLINLLAACDSVSYRAFVSTGDSFEYAASMLPLREDSECKPDRLHGITKLAATLYAKSIADRGNRPILTLRLFSIYGPQDNPRRLIPRLITAARHRAPIALSDPTVARDWLYVDDVARLYLEAAARASDFSGSVFNAGSGEKTTLAELADTIMEIIGTSGTLKWGAYDPSPEDAFPWVANMTKTHQSFSWRPSYSREQGLRTTIKAAVAADTK